jgi:hypothetical protein
MLLLLVLLLLLLTLPFDAAVAPFASVVLGVFVVSRSNCAYGEDDDANVGDDDALIENIARNTGERAHSIAL